MCRFSHLTLCFNAHKSYRFIEKLEIHILLLNFICGIDDDQYCLPYLLDWPIRPLSSWERIIKTGLEKISSLWKMFKDHNLQPPGCQIIVKMPWSLAVCVVVLERFPTNSHTLLTSSSSLLPAHWDRHSWEINLQILLAAVCLQLVLCIISLLTTLSKIIPTFSKCAQWSSSPPRSCFELGLKKEKVVLSLPLFSLLYHIKGILNP